jgi:hypothetical protein
VSSFGKTYHVTGWKVGYVAAPAALTAEFRKVHQFNVFTVNTPMQHGLASYMADPAPYLNLPAFYQRKRDLFRAGLARTKLPAAAQRGQLLPVRRHLRPGRARARTGEAEFCQWLTSEIGVAAIPLSAFYGNGFDQKVIRFCFAKRDETLKSALQRLAAGVDRRRRAAGLRHRAGTGAPRSGGGAAGSGSAADESRQPAQRGQDPPGTDLRGRRKRRDGPHPAARRARLPTLAGPLVGSGGRRRAALVHAVCLSRRA